MSPGVFALIVGALVVLIFVAMWRAWQARATRDAAVFSANDAPKGEMLAVFDRLHYVSTTPVDEPLVRVAAAGLRYRGPASITVFSDGITLDIAGEAPVHFSASQLRGSDAAGRRVGKAVEAGGLALLRWQSLDKTGRELESSFRFELREDQQHFAELIDQISASPVLRDARLASSQEGEK